MDRRAGREPMTMKSVRGFTLVEVIVAMAIMALIGVGAMKVFDIATFSTSKLRMHGDRLNDVQRAFLFISNDLQQLTTRRVRDEFGDFKPALKSDLQASAPFIRLTRLGRRNPAMLPRSNLEHLIYQLEDKILYRISYTYADGMQEDMGLKRPLLVGVEDMKFSFYDGEDWGDYWPLEESDQQSARRIPNAIKMTLELTDYGVIERVYAISELTDLDSESQNGGSENRGDGSDGNGGDRNAGGNVDDRGGTRQ